MYPGVDALGRFLLTDLLPILLPLHEPMKKDRLGLLCAQRALSIHLQYHELDCEVVARYSHYSRSKRVHKMS